MMRYTESSTFIKLVLVTASKKVKCLSMQWTDLSEIKGLYSGVAKFAHKIEPEMFDFSNNLTWEHH